jgi:DNA-binding SARP family transcriptional activator
VAVRPDGKISLLLCNLALQHEQGVRREALLEALWPASEVALAGQSLNSLVYEIQKTLGGALGGAAPVIYANGSYRLNREAGVGTDLQWFDALVAAGDQQRRAGHLQQARALYHQAVELYRGDLCAAPADIHAAIERERLRAGYLNVLAHLADDCYAERDFAACSEYALRLVAHDPCREDGHRLLMRCYLHRGERSQALHQDRLCEQLLRSEFDAVPERATRALFDQLRLALDTL